MGGAALALTFARPAAGWALLAPLVFLLWVRRSAHPPAVVTGTLELWREPAARASAPGRARWRFPAWALLCALALALAALAWLGPRGARAGAVRTWTCVVDRSPSMAFPAAGGAGTRLDAALAAARDWLARASFPDDRMRWLAPGREALELAPGALPERAWFATERDGGAPEWGLHDAPGALWITDREPPLARAHAGLFASGGPSVPGPVAADGRTTWTWDGGDLRAVPQARASAVRVEAPGGAALPAVLERVLAAWCGARGFELARAPSSTDELLVVELAAAAAGDEGELVLERDGWRALGRGALADEGREPGGEEWLAGRARDGAPRSVVRVVPGRIRVGLRELSEPSGDQALFALSWARLFDRAARPPAGVVALAEREAAGAPVFAPPSSAPASEGLSADRGPLADAALATGALLLALLAFLRLPREPLEHAVSREPRRAAARHQ